LKHSWTFLFCILARSAAVFAQAGADGTAGPPATSLAPAAIDPAIQSYYLRPQRDEKVKWKSLFLQSSVFLAAQHGVRLATERGTREALKGPFFPGWGDAVGNMHGWADGDPFFVNYIGHPMQGAVSGYIWTQNDPKYYDVEFGKSRDYWKSRLRATAFSFLYSAQFEYGPISEATIGNVQKYYPQQGFVDTAMTPVLGMAWQIGEDFFDKVFVKRFEDRFANPYLRILVRGGANPARSWANMMRFKVPWAREDRVGVYSYPTRKELEFIASKGYVIAPPKRPVEPLPTDTHIARTEVKLQGQFHQYTGSDSPTLCFGGGSTIAYRATPNWQLLADISGCNLIGLGENKSGDSLSYLFGPRWIPATRTNWRPHFHLLVGGVKIVQETEDPRLKALLKPTWAIRNKENPLPPDPPWLKFEDENGLAVSVGMGLDYRINRAMALNVGTLSYQHSWVKPVDGLNYRHDVRVTSGFIVRLGTW
jgi:hypothetical protein